MNAEGTWSPLPADLSLAGDEIHVVRLNLDRPADEILNLRSLLAADELARAGRFYHKRDSLRYVAGRGVLRTLLGRYLDREPAELRLVYGERGKPALDPAASQGDLQFNLAHSEALALLAFGRGHRLGVDVEYPRSMRETDDIARNRFSPREYAAYRALPQGEKQAGFFNCWTRKEAYIKATGLGTAGGLRNFTVTLAPGEEVRLLSIDGDPTEAARWSLLAIDPGEGAYAALAARALHFRLRLWDWPG